MEKFPSKVQKDQEFLVDLNLNVTNGGLSDMTKPVELLIQNPNIKLQNVTSIRVDPLKSRESRQISLVAKVKNSDAFNVEKEFNLKNGGLPIDFKYNEFF